MEFGQICRDPAHKTQRINTDTVNGNLISYNPKNCRRQINRAQIS